MKIINRTTAPMHIRVYLFVPASSTRASFTLHPNQSEVLRFTDSPPSSGSLSVYEVYRYQVDESRYIERLTVPSEATIVFSSDVQTGLFGNS